MCSNAQVQGNILDTTVWSEVSKLLMNPERVELEDQNKTKNSALLDNLETLESQRAKLERAVERLIDSFAEGLIENDQFASRMASESLSFPSVLLLFFLHFVPRAFRAEQMRARTAIANLRFLRMPLHQADSSDRSAGNTLSQTHSFHLPC